MPAQRQRLCIAMERCLATVIDLEASSYSWLFLYCIFKYNNLQSWSGNLLSLMLSYRWVEVISRTAPAGLFRYSNLLYFTESQNHRMV